MKEGQPSTEYKILEAAEKLFLEQGFMKTTTLQIAKEAGCNQALVHYYYRTKEQLFEKIYGEKIQLLFKNMLNIREDAPTFEEGIKRMIEIHYDFVKQNPLVITFMLREWLNNSTDGFNWVIGEVRKHIRPLFLRLEKEIDEEVAKGHIRPISAIHFILTILSLDIFPFIMLPFMQKVLEFPASETDIIAEQRKQEIIDTVMARLRI